MGNANIKKVPEDLTKCSDKQLRFMINSVIINNPWNEDTDCSDAESLLMTIEVMRQKGFRPILPKEYVEELKIQRKSSNPKGVRVWIPIKEERCTTPDQATAKVDPRFTLTRDVEHKAGAKSDSDGHNTDSVHISCSDSKSSAGNFSDAYGGTDSSMGSFELQLPSSRQNAVNVILKSGASDAVLSELSYGEDATDNENTETEEWPTYGSNLKYHRTQQQYN